MRNSFAHLKTRFCAQALVLGFAVFGGCSTISNITKPAPAFNLTEHAPYLQNGLATVRGVVRVGGAGQPQSCIGGRVYLMPDTPFFEAKLAAVTGGSSPDDLGLEDDRYDHVVRRANCDVAGQFFFDALPGGQWVVLTQITLPKGANGPALAAHLTTQAGVSAQITLDQSNLAKK